MKRRKPFDDSYERLRWAKNDIAQFERCANRFFQRTKYSVVTEPYGDRTRELHKFVLAKKLPSTLARRTVQAVENMLAALEYTAVTVGRLSGATDLKHIHFPFCTKASDLKSRINSACGQLPKEFRDFFASFDPHAGGDDPLWAIHELCIASKHNLLLRPFAQSGVKLPFISSYESRGPIEIVEGVSESTENEIVFARTPREFKWKYHLQVAFGVAFGEVDCVKGRPVYPNLVLMHQRASVVVADTEKKCMEIGLM